MPEQTREQKKEFAKIAYVQLRLTQAETAKKVGVAPKTINQWVNKEKWDELRTSFIVTKEQQLRRVYAQMDELTSQIEKRPAGQRYADSKEADTLVKLTAAVKSLESETSIAEAVDVFKKYTNWLRAHDLQKAQEQMPTIDDFIKSLLK